MKLTSQQIRHVAKLANLPISSQEEEHYLEQLSDILEYIKQLDQVPVSHTDSTFNTSMQSNVNRPDQTDVCLVQSAALSNASEKKDGFFLAKGIFDNE